MNLDLSGPNAPSWDILSDENWQDVLTNFVFKIADGFAFGGVVKKADLFSFGVTYFADWELDPLGLAETDDDVVGLFRLNEPCQKKLLEYDYPIQRVTGYAFDSIEFDSLYFFSDDRMVGHYIHHESELIFYLNDRETALLANLAPPLKAQFTDYKVIAAFWEAWRNRS